MKHLITTTIAALGLSACASITTGTSQPITVDTPYAQGAQCQLMDTAGGSWFMKDTPNTVTVNKGNGPMTIKCEKSGFQKGTTILEETFQGATLGNIILGGGVGIIVDAATGAAQEYPKQAKVYLQPNKWDSSSHREQWMQEKRQYDQMLENKVNPNQKSDSAEYPSQRRR
jgi:uncharacterized protein YceK